MAKRSVIACVLVACSAPAHEAPLPHHAAPATVASAGTLPDDPEQRRFDEARHPDAVVAALALRPGARVADIGAGAGLFTVHLALAVGATGKVVATDIDGSVLDLLAERMARAHVANVERRVVGGDTPELEAASYDVIVLAEVDHDLADAVAWLRAARAALRPGGRIAITNRTHHRARSIAAAQAAGLVLASESAPTDTHFLAVFTAP